mmetsp:Transcript_28340/g.43613  ORF Transcript_28340/g.43613 Transcript_28340/m.43613 type:complete len:116 (-) Transcript_28340:735-1082(-)
MDNTSKGANSRSQTGVNQFDGVGNVIRWIAERDVEEILDGLVETLADGICLRILDTGWNRLDTIDLEHGLKIDANEFGALIMNAAKRLRVARQPMVDELHRAMGRCLVFNADTFC